MGQPAADLVRTTDDVALNDETVQKLRELKRALPTLQPDDVAKAIIWADAAAAAGRIQRSWEIEREASEVRIRAERRLGQLLVGQWDRLATEGLDAALDGGARKPGLAHDWKKQGAYGSLGKMPEDLFESTVQDLLGRRRSLDVFTFLRSAHLRSAKEVERGIAVAWDGAYFLADANWRLKRAKGKELQAVREELYERERLTKPRPRTATAKALDEAFAEARRYAQSLSNLRGGIHGEAGRLIAEAELLQAQVASLLFEAYRTTQVAR